MRYFIADCHFYHDRARALDQRPFQSVEEMNDYMICRWNEVVKKKKDEVMILGDFCFGKAPEVNEILSRLNGKKYLIVGNHDQSFLRDKNFDQSQFGWVRSYAELRSSHRQVILSHYPMLCYNGQYRGDNTWMLYGHVHNTKDYQMIQSFVTQSRQVKIADREEYLSSNLINCFAGFSDYRPLTLDQWIEQAGHLPAEA